MMDPLHVRPIGSETLLANLFSSVTFRALFLVSTMIGLALVPITYWALDNVRPYLFYVEESYILPTTASGNDQMIVSWKVKVNRQCEGLVRRELFDPRPGGALLAIYDAQPAHKTTMPLGEGQFNRTFLLPKQMQPGKVGYRARLEYWCNPLQRIWPIQYNTPELFFEVKG